MPRKTKKKGSAANTHVFDNVTVRFWYGGQFKHVRNGEMVYKGGSYINFDVDPDELCYWDLRDYGSKCGLAHVDALFYQMPGLNIEKGLRVIQGDAEVLEMGKLAVVNRSIVVYAVQFEREVGEGSNAEVVEVDVGNTSQKSTLLNADPKVTISKTTGKVLEKPPPKLNKRKKLTTRKGPQTQVVKPSLTEEDASTSPIKASTTSPKKASITLPEKASDLPQKKTKKQTQPPLKITSETQPFTQNQSLHLSQFPSLEFVSTGELPDVNTDFNDEFEWEDDRPESPLKWNELVADDESSDDSDPLYDHEYQKFCEGGEFEDDDEDDFQFEVDESIEKEKEGDFSLSDIDLEGEGEDLEQTDFFEDESDDIDDEIIEARDRVKRVNTKLLEIVKGLQEKDSVVPDEPAPKRPKGRPRKTAPSTDVTSHAPSTQATPTPTLTQTASSSTPATQFAHHTATAQPTQLGRGGRMILGGQGARSVSQSSTRGRSSAGRGSTTTSRGRGRGRGRAQPSGIGIMFADDGSPIVTAPSTRPNTRSISQMQQ
uniref:PB1-like domain-containing protein n=1 Tax=Chenopodium quinoa TaxID=63459 RepID=A0A803N7H7_CHEQI